MPNIASVLKAETGRIARKEIKGEVTPLRNASAQYRRDIAALKRIAAELDKRIGKLEKLAPETSVVSAPVEDGAKLRVTSKGVRALRKRLALSAEEFGKLVGVSAQSIYNWESAAARPRKEQVGVLAALRTIGKKEARARLG